MSIAFFSSAEPELEAYGVELINWASRQLRRSISFPPLSFIPAGPGFNYEFSPDLFLGRVGGGPLHVVWDTNLLIDYCQHGRAIWKQELDPEELGEYGDDLEALQLILATWAIRDIRFHILPRTLTDAKRKLTKERQEERAWAVGRFTDALRLVGADPETDPPSRDGLLILPDSELDRRLQAVPSGADRELVRDAVKLGATVFLTRDKGVLASSEHFRAYGLLVASPGDLLEALAGCGALHCFVAPQYAYWPLPDQGRVADLVKALLY